MPLSSDQRATLEAEAQRRGIDPAKLIDAAEKDLAGSAEGAPAKPGAESKAEPSSEQPKLFMYLLPFVTVREVRQVWLGLTDSFPGDGEVASKWAAKQSGDVVPADVES